MTLDPEGRGGNLLMTDLAEDRKAREIREKRGSESEKRHGMRLRKIEEMRKGLRSSQGRGSGSLKKGGHDDEEKEENQRADAP